ncbi:MAG: PorV/PorQ family protein [Candidatus Margulisbacteria bacterium]|nr:PorV/PorQ family protein [Candidatus Margulisiibacteriota bacterium]
MGHKQLILLLILNCLLCGPTYAQTTFDPLSIGVGARALGMGKTYTAVAEDAEVIFTNPAGLGEIDGFKFTSMSGTIMEDLRYSILGGVYPLGEKSAFGVGYAAAAVSGIEIRDLAGTLQKSSNYSNNVFIASYGRKLTDKFSFGLNFKYYSQDGSEINDGDGAGTNLDIGVLQKGLGWLSLGLVGQNLLSSSKLHFKNGENEALPQTIKVGARMFLLGERFESASISPMELIAALDADLSLEGSKPITVHSGLEFTPSPQFTVRTGMDQVPKPGGIQSFFTGGISLRLAGIGFHYAYHPYTEAAESAGHFFTLTFDERGWPLEEAPGDAISQE